MVDAELRLMMVHAHPDDESSKGAATAAKYVAQGVDVLVVTLTGGERGSVLNPALDTPEVRANLAGVRRAEMARAAAELGVRHRWLGFIDSGLPEGDPPPPLPAGCFAALPLPVASRALVALLRAERPHVVVTYDETGGYPHPDHVMCHRVSVAAFDAAGDPDRFPGTGEPWTPLKLYYVVSHHRRRLRALHEAMVAAGLDSPYAERMRDWGQLPDEPDRVTTRIDCAEHFATRDRALLAHRTQVDPSSFWFACPLELQQAAWPTEDFQLARALVDTHPPETDLFAGVRQGATRGAGEL